MKTAALHKAVAAILRDGYDLTNVIEHLFDSGDELVELVEQASEPVRYEDRCHIYLCPACDRLFDSARSDARTCSPACRTKASRNGCIDPLRVIARTMDITVADILQGQAMRELVPDIHAKVKAGTMSSEDAEAATRTAFWKRAAEAAELSAE